MSITVVNLNPCVDVIYRVPSLLHGGTNRVTVTQEEAAGKGINVAEQLKKLNQSPTCLGFNFMQDGEKLTQKLDSLKIAHNFENVPGKLRTNIKLYENSGVMTELNRQGDYVPDIHVKNLISQVAEANDPNGILVLCGSLPPSVPTNIYAKLTALWQGRVFLDTSGEPLQLALESKLFAIKPNIHELSATFGVTLSTPQDVAAFCRNRLSHIPMVCVSMGADGAVLVTPSEAYFCPIAEVKAKRLQGAGDAMVAGLIHGVLEDKTPPDILRYGVASATAIVADAKFENMLKKVAVPCKLHV